MIRHGVVARFRVGNGANAPPGKELRAQQPVRHLDRPIKLGDAGEQNLAGIGAAYAAGFFLAVEGESEALGDQTFALPEPFLVLATQNPIEQEGTYPLPEAQVDRFMLKLHVGYPSRDEEKEVLRRMASGEPIPVDRVASPTQILETRRHIAELYIDERVVDYIVEIVHATRNPEQAGLAELKPLIEFGASPRATLALAQGSRAHAFLRGRAFVTPDDVKSIAPDVLRHRVLRTYEAEAEEVTT